jgi:hypothetical protein
MLDRLSNHTNSTSDVAATGSDRFTVLCPARGRQFLALNALDAITNNLILSFSAVVITLPGIVFLREHPHPLQ